MDACRVALAASVAAIAACQLDLAGKELVARHDSSDAGGSTEPHEGSADAMAPTPTSDPNPAQDASMTRLTVGQDAGAPSVGVGQGPAAASTKDAGVDASDLDSSSASVDASGGSPCARLLQCCPRLVAPPLALACVAGAMQDGGDSFCETTLSTLTDAGVCP